MRARLNTCVTASSMAGQLSGATSALAFASCSPIASMPSAPAPLTVTLEVIVKLLAPTALMPAPAVPLTVIALRLSPPARLTPAVAEFEFVG